WGVNCRNDHPSAGVHDVFDKSQRVPFLFFRLSKKMLRQLRQRFGGEMRPDGVVLYRSAELVSDLLVDGIDNFLTRKHVSKLPRIMRMPTAWLAVPSVGPKRRTGQRRRIQADEPVLLCRPRFTPWNGARRIRRNVPSSACPLSRG